MPRTAKKTSKRKVSKKIGTRVKKLESMVYKTIENKVQDYDNGSSPTGISTSGNTWLAFLRNMQTGDEGDQRIGNKITLMSQTFRGVIRAPSLPTDEQQNQVRILIVENLGFTGLSDLSIEDVLQKGVFSVDGGQVFISPYKTNAAENKRYKVHYDKVVTLNRTDKGYFHFKKRIAYKNGKVLTFATPSSTFPNNHRLCMFTISDSAVTSHPDINWNVRNIYKDA